MTAWFLLALSVRADDPLSGVASEVERAPARALELLRALAPAAPAGVELRYLHARLLERLGQDSQALAALPDAEAELPAGVVLDVRRRRAVLLARTGRCDEALPIVEVLARERRTTGAVERAAVECALARGDVEDARRRLAGVDAAEAETFALRIRLADVLLAQGSRDEAARELRALLVAHPAHAGAAEAERRLAMLGDPGFSREERIERAEKLADEHCYEASLSELDAAGTPDAGRERARALHVRGMTLYRMRTRYLEAAQALEAAGRLGGPTQASDRFHAARALSRAGRDRKAITGFRAFAERHPESRFATEARYQAAWLELRLGLPAGERSMRRFVDGRDALRARTLARAGRFELALRAFEKRRHREAEQELVRSAREASSAMARAQGRYWAGRAAEAGRRPRDAIVHYEAALSPEPLGWYALLAQARLRALGADPGGPFDTLAREGAPGAQVAAAPASAGATLSAEATFFARLGLRREAIEALRSVEGAAGKDAQASERLVVAYGALGEHARPHRFVMQRYDSLLRRAPAPENAWAWDAAYSRPHADVVAAAAADAGVEADLAYAVMRKESGFDPGVVSYADAVGLMQLLPATAERVAAERGEAYRREELFEPETNVRWGVHLLGALERELGGEPVLALAAYNAGAHQVEPWLAREAKGGRVELDLFVERIPITQTRNYVRRVVGAWAMYAYLADPARGWPFELPRYLVSSARRRR